MEQILFAMPTWFTVESTEFWNGRKIPIFFLATLALADISKLSPRHSVRLMPPYGGDLDFALDEDGVVNIRDHSGLHATALFKDLLDAWKGYSRDICRLLVEAYPELGDRIGNWFRGE